MLPLDVEDIAKLNLWEPYFKVVPVNQTVHRVRLVQAWDILEGSCVLELGCGQGDCTAVLAAAVGESGHVTGVDPAPLDYGKYSESCLPDWRSNCLCNHRLSFYARSSPSPSEAI